MSIDIIHFCSTTPGWAPITHLATVAAQSFEGAVHFGGDTRSGRWRKIVNLRARQGRGDGAVLLALLRSPAEVHALRASAAFRSGYRHVACWIIDSFRHEDYPSARAFRDIDLLIVTRPNDVARGRRIVGDRVIWLGWGANVLGQGSAAPAREVDVLRLGRQPDEWDDDLLSAETCMTYGLRFGGRPPIRTDSPMENQLAVMRALARTRYVVAHSNLASPAPYTHRREEYLTARWTDALACGAVVAGCQPRGDEGFDELLWPGAVLDFDRVDLRHNIAALREATAHWHPGIVARNHVNALRRLDWRWRLETIARHFSVETPRLDAELAQIRLLASHAEELRSVS